MKIYSEINIIIIETISELCKKKITKKLQNYICIRLTHLSPRFNSEGR